MELARWNNFVYQTKDWYTKEAYKRIGNWKDAEDIVQIVYTKLYLRDYPEEGMWSAGILAVKRETLNVYRHRSRRLRPYKKDLIPVTDRLLIQPPIFYTTKDLYEDMYKTLTPKEHSIITAVISGFSYKEIAEDHGHTPRTIKIYIHNIRKKLRKKFPEFQAY